ncbi:MAG: DMT family transporter [Planctomycetes bacterium]|nr:DMT family transporter [Planctomycetota bacterium]
MTAAPRFPDAGARARRVALTLLLLTNVIWGATFPFIKVCTAGIERLAAVTPFAATAIFISWRFALAAALFPLVFPATARSLSPRNFRLGFWLTAPTFGGFLLQFYGMALGTAPAVSAFFTVLFVVFTPLVVFVVERRRPSRVMSAAAILAVCGVALAGGSGGGGSVGLGEWLTLGSAVLFAVQIYLTDRFTRVESPVALTFWMLALSALFGVLVVVIAAGPATLFRPGLYAAAMGETRVWVSVVYSAVLASVVAQFVMNRYQHYVSPARAALLYSLEPVCAGLFSASGLFAAWGMEETFDRWKIAGFALILAANLLVELIGRRER